MNLKKTCLIVLASSAIFTACDEQNGVIESPDGSGKTSIYLTDAPVDDVDVSAVVISIAKVEVKGPDGWKTIQAYKEPVSVDLLSYQNGASFFLGEAQVTAGSYSEVRLTLGTPDTTTSSLSGAYLHFSDSTTTPLTVPGGSESGYKVKGNFEVTEGGETNITLDFDVRKALVKAGESGRYLLKPLVRLVNNEEAGTLKGSFEMSDSSSVIVFAYADNTFQQSEAEQPDEGEVRFANAVSSAAVEEGTFTLAFLNSGTYDLYFASLDENGEFTELLGYYDNVNVQAGSTTKIDINTDLLN